MKVVALLVGIVLLLPGACALSFLVMGLSALPPLGSAEWRDGDVWGMIGIATVGWGFCFLISYGGILLIRNTFKPEAPPPPTQTGDGGPSAL